MGNDSRWGRVVAIATIVAVGLGITPSGAAVAAPDWDLDRVHFLDVGDSPRSTTLSPDGRRLYGASGDIDEPGVLTVVDTVSGTLVAQKTFAKGAGRAVVSADGSRLYVTHGGPDPWAECFVMEVDAKTLRVLRDFALGHRCSELLLSRDGRTLYVSDVGEILFVDIASGTVDLRVPAGSPGVLTLSPSGEMLYVVDHSTGDIRTINTVAKAGWGTIFLPMSSREPETVGNVLVSPSGDALYAVTHESVYTVTLSGPNRTVRHPIEGGVHGSELSRDGTTIYLSQSKDLLLFDTATERFERANTEWGGSANAVSESLDGRRLHVSALGYIITLGATRSIVFADTSLRATAGKRFASPAPVFRYGFRDPTYKISPALPKGLRLNPDTGAISGTPAAAAPSRTHTVFTAVVDADTGELTRYSTRISIRVSKQPTQARAALSRATQKRGTSKPAVLHIAVSPAVAGTFRIYDGGKRVATLAAKKGRAAWKLPRVLSVRAHSFSTVFVPSNRDVYAASRSAGRTLTVFR